MTKYLVMDSINVPVKIEINMFFWIFVISVSNTENEYTLYEEFSGRAYENWKINNAVSNCSFRFLRDLVKITNFLRYNYSQ